jgi:hypothetical protein
MLADRAMLRLSDGDRTLHGLEQARNRGGYLLAILDAAQQHDELVPTQAGDRVGAAHTVLKAVGELDEHAVTGGMSPGVIEAFETIQIQVTHHDQTIFRSPRRMAWRRRSSINARLGRPVRNRDRRGS